MKTKRPKVVKNFIDHVFGFPVSLGTVTLKPFRDDWVPLIDYNKVTPRVLSVLCHLHRPLRGAELRFVRLHFGLTQAQLAEHFGVSHVAVHKWERRGRKATGMQWSSEKDLRLFIQSRLSPDPKAVGKLYEELSSLAPTGRQAGALAETVAV